ncbi:LysR family transcriptional regulator [Bordetella sp. BOR01]|uniref:LysR family transcriptional regulator n=1 Tax=Bordetella sp. BOR01 TaxID=2854779 RepID=UPI001C4396A2|nr:LysR family transcriptional regulator [Bordetella sp. BOR01]MBV7485424.1 LysR family transcriptional regulator [Bordetella sp. BOR01]
MNLSPRQLRIFIYLAESLSFSRTAAQFCVTQPRLSRIVREIEAEIGVRLFDRNTRNVTLTEEGASLTVVASRIAHEFDAGITELDEIARRNTQRIAIAALPTVAAALLPPAVAALRQEMPRARIKVHDVFTDHAIDLLRARKVDLALTGTDIQESDLAYEVLLREPFVLLSSSGFALHLDSHVWSEEAIGALPLISMPRGTGTRRHSEAAFLRKGLAFRPILELHNLASISRFVQAGCGVALLPLTGARLAWADGLQITALEGAPERAIGLVTRRECDPPPLMRKVMASIRQHAGLLETPCRET